ncbi:replication factor C, subunit RFC4 [Spathaspora passalidarum NRRL Y-27907]|uniref:Replication factor C subunit 2 n=1 Tax=Spathaspora passalidarum (strain NRRL Y-27907 / 11-Y1) TaxID=619300 RepID=G3AV27_SPAPN|nr:replication factor C, subunit RFC4 [Spathaspora passalidarum NRRL Y-27907]EGW30100.1 replication factor C, subunit RFC4 [Spathaspora passalidarum NRRL Y-27907]
MTTTDQYEEERLHHTPWVEKYRPKNLDDVASQEHAVAILKRTLATANLPHMLFYGPPGTGKTSTILALSKQLFGPNLSKSRVLELNASDERGINIVRSKIKNFARLTISNPTPEDLANYPCPPYKIIILDEADSMTNDAQSALRRTMETYSGMTRFCLICNYITRIIDPLASRCSKFRFKLLNNDDGLNRLKYIAEQEDLTLDQEEPVLQQVLDISGGDLRKAITYLQSASKLSNSYDEHQEISGKLIRETAGVLYEEIIDELVNVIKGKNHTQISNYVNEIILQGWSIQQLISQLHDKLILDDSIDSLTKNQIAINLFETDKRLNNGSDEHIQLLNLSLQISKVM